MSNIEVWVTPVEVANLFNQRTFKAYTKPSKWSDRLNPLYCRVKAVVSVVEWRILAVDLHKGEITFTAK